MMDYEIKRKTGARNAIPFLMEQSHDAIQNLDDDCAAIHITVAIAAAATVTHYSDASPRGSRVNKVVGRLALKFYRELLRRQHGVWPKTKTVLWESMWGVWMTASTEAEALPCMAALASIRESTLEKRELAALNEVGKSPFALATHTQWINLERMLRYAANNASLFKDTERYPVLIRMRHEFARSNRFLELFKKIGE